MRASPASWNRAPRRPNAAWPPSRHLSESRHSRRRAGGADDPGRQRRRTGNHPGARRRRGATSAGYVLLRLPHEIKQLFEDWLARHMPDRAARVLSLIRQTRGGALYDRRMGPAHDGRRAGGAVARPALRPRLPPARLNVERFRIDSEKFKVPADAVAERNGGQFSLL